MFRFFWLAISLSLLVVGCGGRQSDLTVDQAIQAFTNAGLECENPQTIDPNDTSPVPKTFTEAKRCVVPSVNADHGLRVFAFASDRDLQQVQAYYEGFTGMFGSYVFVRDNLLFQTSVSMPKELADQYQETFQTFTP
ncbi:MAG: hypothetical protein KJ063_02350 [Anaerolineae bacterium]|nr:hypothetical protein [Anaerolineae bacterium]